MSDNSEKMHYIGLAFENENDAKIAQKALAKCEDRTSEAFCVTSTDTNVDKVIDILRGIDSQYQARCIVCHDQCEHIA